MLGPRRTVAAPLLQEVAPRSVSCSGKAFILASVLIGLVLFSWAPSTSDESQQPTITMANPLQARTRFPTASSNRFLSSPLQLAPKRFQLPRVETRAQLLDNMWQARLDKALLNVDVEPSERLSLLREALTDTQLAEDLRSAATIIQEKGLREGHPEFIEKLWPKGTTARADLEGLNALRKQVPEVLRDVQSQVQQSPQNLFPATTAGAGAATQPNFNLTSVIGSLRTLATDPERQQRALEEAKDLLRPTPKGLETPEYQVVRMIDGPKFLNVPEPIELRSYEAFTVAKTGSGGEGFTSRSGAAGFNTLASYLFGNNEAKQAMAMTMPVEMTSYSMSFVLPKKYSSEPPAPLTGSDIVIDKVPARLIAAKPFPGIVTDEEIERQKEALLEAIMKDGSVVPVDESQVIVLQYNSPLTIPWRRRNEVAIVVKEKAPMEQERVFDFEKQGEVGNDIESKGTEDASEVGRSRGGNSPPGRRA